MRELGLTGVRYRFFTQNVAGYTENDGLIAASKNETRKENIDIFTAVI